MAAQQYRLSLKSSFTESEKIPGFVESIQKKAELEEEVSGKLMLLLSEAVTNAIVHGNKEDPSKKVDVLVAIERETVISTVVDEGDGFDANQDTPDPLAEENLLKASGRGLFLLNEMSDLVEHFDDGKGIKFVIYR